MAAGPGYGVGHQPSQMFGFHNMLCGLSEACRSSFEVASGLASWQEGHGLLGGGVSGFFHIW